ncbi:MAG: hypothetical protein HYZ26_11725 [Chloroflexi bacterium]|nr:hypothetical protein [Chloroflexota bacterium]
MDWNDYAFQHEFTLALAQLQQTKRPLWQRLWEPLADLFWRAMIPALTAVRQQPGLTHRLQTLGDAFQRQPRAFRNWCLVFLGWLSGLAFGFVWAWLIP